MTNIYREESWGKIIEAIDPGHLYLIGSPHPVELDYLKNTLLITTTTYEYRSSLCQILSTELTNLTKLKIFDYEFNVPTQWETNVKKNFFMTKESRSVLKLLTWVYYLCHYKVTCRVHGDHEMMEPLIEHCSKEKKIIHLLYDQKRRDLCTISLDR